MLNGAALPPSVESRMNDETSRLFQTVATKMGWMDKEGLDTAVQRVCCRLQFFTTTM